MTEPHRGQGDPRVRHGAHAAPVARRALGHAHGRPPRPRPQAPRPVDAGTVRHDRGAHRHAVAGVDPRRPRLASRSATRRSRSSACSSSAAGCSRPAHAFNSVHEGVTFLRDFEAFRATPAGHPCSSDRGRAAGATVMLSVDQLGYRYPGAPDDALRGVSFELRRGQIMADRRRQRVGQDDAGEAGVRSAPADARDDPLGRRRPGRMRSVPRPGADRAGVPGLRPVHAHDPSGDRARRPRAARRRAGDPARRAAQAGVERADRVAARRLDTPLGKAFTGGTDLSIGQWQRLAIARALFRDAPMVVLDEPSASLDPRAEAELFDLLHTLCHDRIVIFVSHRFATVRDGRRGDGARPGRRGRDGLPRRADGGRGAVPRPVRAAGRALRPGRLTCRPAHRPAADTTSPAGQTGRARSSLVSASTGWSARRIRPHENSWPRKKMLSASPRMPRPWVKSATEPSSRIVGAS